MNKTKLWIILLGLSLLYSLPKRGKTRLCVYNLKGQLIRELVNEEQERGQYLAVWDGTDKKARQVSSGIYFAHLVSGTQNYIHRMILMK